MPLALLGAVVAKSARMTARWMLAGFVHGVLNTDNMNINGESFDYGPYRFIPRNDPNFGAAYFDESGLYSFGRQPEAVFWNLRQLGGTLTLVTGQDALVEALNSFAVAYRDELKAAMLNRLGLTQTTPEADIELVNSAFRALSEGGEALLIDERGGREGFPFAVADALTDLRIHRQALADGASKQPIRR
mgnify:CR=1 FL=1